MPRNNVRNVQISERNRRGKGSCCKIIVISTALLAAGLALCSYKVYVAVTEVPDMPEIDVNNWWGPDESKNNQDTSIRPFRVYFTEAMQEELSRIFDFRRRSTPVKSFNDTAWTYGMSYQAVEKIFDHWQFKYKYNARQRYLNQFNHFKTNIQGLDIHFIHVKPTVEKNIKVLPIILLHGWASSVREFYEVIPRLTTVRPGYDFVFEVIVPSLPGFAYSQAATKPGLWPCQIAIMMRNLMNRLGFTQYYVQGGDFGHIIGTHMATIFPKEVLGFHTNMPLNFSKYAALAWILGSAWPEFIEDKYMDRMYPLQKKINYLLEESGYMHIQGTKPDTVGIALQDSPLGLAVYILDRFMVFTNIDNKFLDDGGLTKDFSLTDLLDNIMLYWATNSITTSMRIYKEAFSNVYEEELLSRIPTLVPTWGLRFKHEVMFQPEFLIRWKFTNLLGTTTLEYGGHFAAFESPREFADDIFLAVQSFRTFKY